MKNNMTFDVETAGSLWKPLIYDIGWVITSPQGKVLKKQRFIIEEIFNQKVLMDTAYFANKVKVHYKELEHITVPFMKMLQAFRNDVKKYEIKRLLAYNLLFDIRAMVASYNRILAKGKKSMVYKDNDKIDNRKSFKVIIEGDYQYLDIWSLVCETVMIENDYQEFILDNSYLTEKGNYLTNAEVCYKYMFGDNGYIEKHTGLDDAIDEMMIYHNLDRKKVYKAKSYKDGFLGSPWRVVKNFFNVS